MMGKVAYHEGADDCGCLIAFLQPMTPDGAGWYT